MHMNGKWNVLVLKLKLWDKEKPLTCLGKTSKKLSLVVIVETLLGECNRN
jgi:hypothetical protein